MCACRVKLQKTLALNRQGKVHTRVCTRGVVDLPSSEASEGDYDEGALTVHDTSGARGFE